MKFLRIRNIQSMILRKNEFNKQNTETPITPEPTFENRNFSNPQIIDNNFDGVIQESEIVEESLSLQDMEVRMIRQALKKHNGIKKTCC